MNVGVIGGGILGLVLTYYLTRRGIHVTLFEGRDKAGGLLDYFQVDGAWIDKYYHCILGDDVDLLDLVEEIGLQDRVRFTQTKQGVYYGGKTYSMASGRDFLLFPPLNPIERFRLGLTVLQAFLVKDYHELEQVPVEDWLIKLGGRGAFEKIWKPLLRAKFDGNYDRTPATYIWSRVKRTSSPKAAAGQKDRMGHFVGSYKVLVDRLSDAISVAGSSLRLGTKVSEVLVEDGRAAGVVVDGQTVPLDAIIATTPLPILRRLLPDPYPDQMDWPEDVEFLGVVCGLLLMDRSLTPYYTLNIADEEIPFTGIIETTNLIAPEHVAGYHLIYLPKYVTPSSPYARYTDDELRPLYLKYLKQMFPSFSDTWVKHLFVFRERFVEPLHPVGTHRPTVPVTTRLPGLYVVNNGQIYPELTNCQASVQHTLRVLPTLLADLTAAPLVKPVAVA